MRLMPRTFRSRSIPSPHAIGKDLTAQDAALAKAMHGGYWVTFALRGKPTAKRAPGLAGVRREDRTSSWTSLANGPVGDARIRGASAWISRRVSATPRERAPSRPTRMLRCSCKRAFLAIFR